MTKSKAFLPVLVLALALVAGVFLFPETAFAASGDTTPPVVTVEVDGGILKATATDDTAVASIFIGGSRFSTLADGTATVRLKDYAGDGRQVEVYATDTSGNKSQIVPVDNPYYQEPVASQPQASAPQAQAQAPSRPASPSGGSALAPASTPAASTSTPSSSTPAAPASAQEAGAPASAVPEAQPPAASDNSAGSGPSSAATNGPGAFTPDGGGTVMDNAAEGDGKEFFTVTATDGSVYYLIIDRQRGTQNVYFLSAVTKDDLLGLAQDADPVTAPGLPQPEPQAPGSSQGDSPSPTPQPEEPGQENGGGSMGTVIFILIAAGAAGGAGYYFKVLRPRKQAAQEDEYEEYEDEPEEAEDEYFFDDAEPQQETPGSPAL